MSTLKETFEKLLQGVEVVDYSNTDDFKAVWDKTHCDKPLLILWSMTARDDKVDHAINTTSAVSPLELSVNRASKAGGDITQWPRIAILDCTPTAHESATLYQSIRSLRPERIPWLTLLTPKDLVSNDTQQTTDVLSGLLYPKFDWNNVSASQKKQIEETLKQLKRLIRLNITEGGSKAEFDRHALSNLVAPMILRGGKTPLALKDSIHLPALRKLLEAVELMPKDETSSAGAAQTTSARPNAASPESGSVNANHTAEQQTDTPPEPPLDLSGIQLVLLDDQGAQGWQEWLEETLSTKVALQKSPTVMLRRLKTALEPAGVEKKDWPKDLRFKFNPAEAPDETKQPILLLDLRLFSGDTSGEVAFFKELYTQIKDHFLDKTDLAWPSFKRTDRFEAAATALEQGAVATDSPPHHELLTWFTRVLALADMSLPIVLFSSSGRRNLVEPFKQYGNIITTFSKPSLQAAEVSEECSRTPQVLNRAVAHAVGIAKARDEVTNILKRKTDRLDAAKEQFTGKEIVEIYHDESGTVTDRRFVVAHLVVGFESEPSASCANDAAKEEVFYIDQPTGYAAYTFQTPALDQWTNQLGDAFNRIVTKAKAALAPFVVAADEPLQAQGGDRFGLIDPEGLDNINNDLLRLLAEAVLFDSLPWILSDSAKLHYRAATRMRNVSMLNGETQWDLDKKLKDKWGNYSPLSNTSANEYSWQSLSVGNIAPMLADVIGGRGESEKRGFVERAIETAFGQTMSKGQLPKLLDFKYLHYFADRIATLTQYHDVTKLVSLAQLGACVALASSVTGFTGVRSRLLGLLNAHRCLDVEDKGGALFLATSGILAADLVSDVLLHRLQAKVPFLNGREYMNFVRYKEEPPQYLKQNTLGAPQRLSIKQTAAPPQASGGSSRQYARGQAQMQGAARPKLKTVRRMHPDTVCIKGLPPAVDEGALVAELANLGLEGEVMSIKRNSTSALVLIKVGEERLNQLLADQQSHFTLFSNRCQVTQAFEMVRED